MGIVVAVAPRVIFRKNTPRAAGCLASSTNDFPSTALLLTYTSMPATGTSNSSGSSTSLAPSPISLTSASRGPTTATTSSCCNTVSAVASSIVPFLRMRWTKTRAPGSIASASAARRPTAFPSFCTRNARNPHRCQAEPAPPISLVPPNFSSYSLQAAGRFMRSSFGPSRAITSADPRVPNM